MTKIGPKKKVKKSLSPKALSKNKSQLTSKVVQAEIVDDFENKFENETGNNFESAAEGVSEGGSHLAQFIDSDSDSNLDLSSPEIDDGEELPFLSDLTTAFSSDLSTEPSSDSGDADDKSSRENSAVASTTPTTKALATADPLTTYLASIRKYPLLTREEEQKLAKKYYETKDPVAAQALVTANLRFVVKVASEYAKFGPRLIDLIQEGNVGLMHAVREFNPYKGVRLITYAVWWIKGYIQEYLMRQYSLVRIGTTQTQRKLFYQLQRERETLEALGENPDFKKLSEKLGISEEEISDMQSRLTSRDISLDRPLDENTKVTLGDLQSSKQSLPLDEDLALREQLSILRAKVEELRPSLSPRELVILDERLLADEPLTLQEIGEKYSITREAIRQMEVRVLNKIKKKFIAELDGIKEE